MKRDRQYQLLYNELLSRGMGERAAARKAIELQPGCDAWLKEEQGPNWWGWILALKVMRAIAMVLR